jgi:hypothetical protein
MDSEGILEAKPIGFGDDFDTGREEQGGIQDSVVSSILNTLDG